MFISLRALKLQICYFSLLMMATPAVFSAQKIDLSEYGRMEIACLESLNLRLTDKSIPEEERTSLIPNVGAEYLISVNPTLSTGVTFFIDIDANKIASPKVRFSSQNNLADFEYEQNVQIWAKLYENSRGQPVFDLFAKAKDGSTLAARNVFGLKENGRPITAAPHGQTMVENWASSFDAFTLPKNQARDSVSVVSYRMDSVAYAESLIESVGQSKSLLDGHKENIRKLEGLKIQEYIAEHISEELIDDFEDNPFGQTVIIKLDSYQVGFLFTQAYAWSIKTLTELNAQGTPWDEAIKDPNTHTDLLEGLNEVAAATTATATVDDATKSALTAQLEKGVDEFMEENKNEFVKESAPE